MSNMENAVDMIMDGLLEEAQEELLSESIEDKLLKNVAETSYMNYLVKFENYINDLDLYLFDDEKHHWDNAEVLLDKIKVDKFWVTIYLIVDKDTDLRGAKRILNDKQNQIQYKKIGDDQILLKFKILKRYLDKLEQKDKSRAEDIASKEAQTSTNQV